MKKNTIQKLIKITYSILILIILIAPSNFVFAQPCSVAGQTRDPADGICKVMPPAGASSSVYKFLAPLAGKTSFDASQSNALSAYLNIIIKVLIGSAAVLAMIMIVMGGVEYMTSGLVSSKEEGKRRITNAIVGLLVAMSAYLLLFTINPNLLKTIDANDESQFATTVLEESNYEGDFEGSTPIPPLTSSGPSGTASITALQSMGVYCPGSGGESGLVAIAKSFMGKVTYSQASRNTINGSIPTILLDCSSYVTKIYQCAGLASPAGGSGTTLGIFASKTPVPVTSSGTLDVSKLKVGDLVGWTVQDYGAGHVLMYIGNGQFIDSRGCGKGKNCAQVAPNSSIKLSTTIMKKIKWINPI